MLPKRCKRFFAFLIPVLLFALAVSSQEKPSPAQEKPPADQAKSAEPTADNADALRKAAQNPVASLISVPIQNNSNFGIEPGYRTQDVLNIQPVIPMGVSKNWNLIIRWITPIIWQPLPSSPEIGSYGFGDMQPTFFLSPKKTGKVIWGVGPIFQLPTATSEFLGQGKFGLGPSVVVLTQPGPWTIGALANNVWSVAGPSQRPDVNQMLVQWFLNYNLKKGWYVGTQPIITANWEATNGGRWVFPLGGSIGRIMKLGFQPVNLQIGFYGNAVHPPGASPWNMRAQIAFLFPKLSPAMKEKMMEEKLKEMQQKK